MLSTHLNATIFSATDDPGLFDDVLRFRKALFVDHLGWDLKVEAERERDEFDTEAAIYCALRQGGSIVAAFRALRADGPYLARSVFPDLATIRPYPVRADMWEISRFGVAPRFNATRLSMLNYAIMFRFAFTREATALIAIADLVYERYLTALGVKTRRYGAPQVVGCDRHGRPLEIVAGEIPLQHQSGDRFDKLVALANTMEIYDATRMVGHRAVPA